MAVENGSVEGMYRLGDFYSWAEKYDQMIQYYQMAIERGNTSAIYQMAQHFCKVKNFAEMARYVELGKEHGLDIKVSI